MCHLNKAIALRLLQAVRGLEELKINLAQSLRTLRLPAGRQVFA